MKQVGGVVRLVATDLSHHLSCRRLTTLDLEEARGERTAPAWRAPDLAILAQRGLAHEAAYVAHLAEQRLSIVDLSGPNERNSAERTLEAMAAGVDVIVQGALQDGQWFGRPDVLRKTVGQGRFGAWTYEPYDCKLTRETKGATILQLAQYASLLTAAQGTEPVNVYVVPASLDFHAEAYRLLDYAAFYRIARKRLERAVGGSAETYPEPNEHCDVCRWFAECDRQWRRDDHLCLTAGIRKLQRKQLVEWEVSTMERLSSMAVPLTRKPEYGSKEGYVHIREQARVQVQARYRKEPVWELCPVLKDRGFSRLPKPSAGDVFFDLETSRFTGEQGLEYLFGFGVLNEDGRFCYEGRWAVSSAEERAAFEWFVDFVMARWQAHRGMHVYHYGHKEASTLKRLMGWYGTREEAVDRMLRGGVLVDLLSITKQALWASVETYSLKALEPFHGYRRAVALEDAGTAMRRMEHDLEMGRPVDLDSDECRVVAGYNEDDCHSTLALRNWLEGLRLEQVAQGVEIPRLPEREDKPPDHIHARQGRVARVAAALKCDVAEDLEARSEEQKARWLLADLLDWHWREARVGFWEKYRLQQMTDEQLMDEREAIAELQWEREIAPEGRKRNWTSVYTFPPQETGLEEGDPVYCEGASVGKVVWIDPARRMVHLSQSEAARQVRQRSVYSYKIVGTEEQAESLLRFAEAVVEHGFDENPTYETATAMLLRRAPGGGLLRASSETAEEAAVRLALELLGDVLAIQGPPGAGKTYTAAAMILRALAAGKKVGVTANSHKVIVNLLEDVQKAAEREGRAPVRCLHKVTEKSEDLPDWRKETTNNAQALCAFQAGFDILAGTAWLWARADAVTLVDLLFVDEAGQMSLANAIAIAPAARNVVLLGDPQQLEQPVKGSHPEGAAVSALEHLLCGETTMDAKQGLFLDKTWRLHPKICEFTSELFYERKLQPQTGLERQRIEGAAWLGEAGLRFLAVDHDGNQNSSAEEVSRIRELVNELLAPTVHWVDRKGVRRRLTTGDILVVTPYNAQVALLGRALPTGMRIGTVDKFQGQQGPVVIYSMATSTAEDVPRGMEFLYSLNRLNVATSRAMALAIVVGSSRLLDALCQTPRQLRLANALCRYVEMAEGGVQTAVSGQPFSNG